MAGITAMFWDVGGVLLTNGWDSEARGHAVRKFDLVEEEFAERHELVSNEFERGRLTLDDYLECTVFHRPRDFAREEFERFMFSQSQPKQDTLDILDSLARSRKYFLATLNNESLPLNLYRIETFQLRRYFTAFFSSCFLGLTKPEKGIFLAAVNITQRPPQECLYVDDRSLNVEAAAQLGLRTIHFRGAAQLRRDLAGVGIDVEGR